jgi:predicted N-acetyltransferase YhbS
LCCSRCRCCGWPGQSERLAHYGVVRVAGGEGVLVGRIDVGEHDWSGFGCGVSELDAWLRDEAVAADRRPGSRVLVATVAGRVVGCVQLSALQVEASSDGPVSVGEGARPTPIGAVLISRLGVDRAWQRRGVAGVLGWHAVVLAVAVAVGTRARLLVVCSEGDQQFGVRLGFWRLAGHPGWGFLPIQDVQATIAAAEAGGR